MKDYKFVNSTGLTNQDLKDITQKDNSRREK